MSRILLFATCALTLGAQDGADIYRSKCASCHEHPAGRVPGVSALRAMSSAAILSALDRGVMKSQAAGLNEDERRAVAAYLAPAGGSRAGVSNPCASQTALRRNAPVWASWGVTPENTRLQPPRKARLAAAEVPKLRLKWAFDLGTGAIPRSQPAIAFGLIFVGGERDLYALDARTGCARWIFRADAPVRTGVVVDAGAKTVLFGAQSTVYAVSADSGKLVWRQKADDHPAAILTGTPAIDAGVLYVPVSSFEEAAAASAQYPCCSFRGSVVAFKAATGEQLWKTYTIEKGTPGARGPSGAAVWSTPTIDRGRGVLYIATGDNYSPPATTTSDAVLAIDVRSGELLWARQVTPNDIYTIACDAGVKSNCPAGRGSDFDFGQPPILISLRGGRRVLVIGQKSGIVTALDPDNQGKVLWNRRIGKGGPLGGIQWGSAAEDGRVYVALSDVRLTAAADPGAAAPRMVLDPEQGGGLFALDAATGDLIWSAKPASCNGRKQCSPAQSAPVTAIRGAVFSGALDGHLRAYSSENGQVLWDEDTTRETVTVNRDKAHGGSLDVTGPVIADGRLYVLSGYGTWGGMPGNVLLAYEVPR